MNSLEMQILKPDSRAAESETPDDSHDSDVG